MTVNFDTYTFEIQNTTNGPTLMCITSENKLKGVKLPSKASWYKAEAAEHTFFPREMYDDIEAKNTQNAYIDDLVKSQLNLSGCKIADEAEIRRKALKEYRAYCYGVFKNIISDILDGIGGYEFLKSMMRYLENDKVSYFINKAICEISMQK